MRIYIPKKNFCQIFARCKKKSKNQQQQISRDSVTRNRSLTKFFDALKSFKLTRKSRWHNARGVQEALSLSLARPFAPLVLQQRKTKIIQALTDFTTGVNFCFILFILFFFFVFLAHRLFTGHVRPLIPSLLLQFRAFLRSL